MKSKLHRYRSRRAILLAVPVVAALCAAGTSPPSLVLRRPALSIRN